MIKSSKGIQGFYLAAVILGMAVFLLAAKAPKAFAAEQAEEKAYLIKVNRVHNTITIYEKKKEEPYEIPIKAMVCSVGKKGTETPRGTFQTQGKYRWKALMGDVWGQYSTRIVGGVLFHSVYYSEYNNPATLAVREYNKLGKAASHGCIRLTVEDAKWIYDHCPLGTTVIIYDDEKSPGPLGKPKARKLASGVRWDPTDPNEKNPYYNFKEPAQDAKKPTLDSRKPALTGVRYRSIFWGKEIDLLDEVKAVSSDGRDITSDIVIKGEVNPYMAGEYEITYSVTDSFNKTVKKTITVKVKESLDEPVITGVADRVVKEGTKINRKLALEGVEAYCSKVRLNPEDIDVAIDEISKEEYQITYTVAVGQQVKTTEQAAFYIDSKAPVISGLSEIAIPDGQTLTRELILDQICVTDNYSVKENIDIKITIEDFEDGTCQITCIAKDEAGNQTEETVHLKFHNEYTKLNRKA
jgi:lipoprotein-anchoring transpeptidase ErfK/SrfK/phenylpyruvate tautomerase PptA (4-oxalocrotonate tautomerase family)